MGKCPRTRGALEEAGASDRERAQVRGPVARIYERNFVDGVRPVRRDAERRYGQKSGDGYDSDRGLFDGAAGETGKARGAFAAAHDDRSAEGIDRPHPAIILPVIEVFRQ